MKDIEPFGKETAKAVQEAAKMTGKAIDSLNGLGDFLNRLLGSPLQNAVGLAIGDPLWAARELTLDWLKRRVEEIKTSRDFVEHAVSPRLAIAIIDGAMDESRPELRELWAQLMANAMDANAAHQVRIEYVSLLKQFNPIDALLLATVAERRKYPASDRTLQQLTNPIESGAEEIDVAISLEHLGNLNCVERQSDKSYQITSLGRGIVIACNPPKVVS